jgi:hypothetical protein
MAIIFNADRHRSNRGSLCSVMVFLQEPVAECSDNLSKARFMG